LEIAASFDKRKYVLESQKSRALKEVKDLKSTLKELTAENEDIQEQFDNLKEEFGVLGSNQTSLIKGFDDVLLKLQACVSKVDRLKEGSVTTVSSGERKRKNSCVSDESSDDEDLKHKKVKKDTLPMLKKAPVPNLSKTFTVL